MCATRPGFLNVGLGESNLGLLTSVVSTFLSQPPLQPLLNSESDLDISS